MSDYIGAIEDYLAWRTSHDGESRDVSPTAYYEHLENLKNARIVANLLHMDLPNVIQDAMDAEETSEAYTILKRELWNVITVIGREADND